MLHCLFRHGACHLTGTAVLIGYGQAAATAGNNCPERNVNQRIIHTLIGLAGTLQPLLVFLFLSADTKHIPIHIGGIVAVCETFPIEGRHQILLHITGHNAFIDGTAVDRGDCCHIFGALHAAFQLQGCHTHGLQFPHIANQTVILQTEGILVLPAAVAIALAAGLGAATTVAGTAADDGRHIALTGVAHAQGAVSEDFDLHRGIFTDMANLIPAQFAAEHHAAHTHGSTKHHTRQAVYGHLGRTMNLDRRRDLAAQLHHIQILHNKGIHTNRCGMADQFHQFRCFTVRNQGIQC